MNKLFIASAVLASMSAFAGSAFAGEQTLSKDCLMKVVKYVNKKHTLAEGAVYAVRTLHVGSLGTVLVVGHSDETDPTDYAIVVKTSYDNNCKIASRAVVGEASDVIEYKKSEELASLFTQEEIKEIDAQNKKDHANEF